MRDSSKKDAVADVAENIVSQEDVAKIAQSVTKDSAVRVLDYRLVDYSTEKLGFLGAHRNLEITLQRKDAAESETLKCFVKSVPYDCELQADFVCNSGIFDKETSFFQTIVPTLTENYEGEKWSPTCYLAKKDALIMEDLRSQGFKLLGKFYDESAPLKSALATLARFHGCSILTEARLSHRSKCPVKLSDCYPGHLKEATFVRTGKSAEWFSAGVRTAMVVAERLGYDSKKVQKAFDRIPEILQSSEIHRNVICHGDLWTNNIMFYDSKPIPKCVLVDFQVIRYSPFAIDILQLLYLNSTRDFRKIAEEHLLAFYHSVLEETIASNDATGKAKSPTLEEVLSAVEDLRLFGAAVAILYIPITLLDPKISADLTKESEGFEKWVFCDRINVTLDYMEKDQFYKKALEEAITEFMEIAESLA